MNRPTAHLRWRKAISRHLDDVADDDPGDDPVIDAALDHASMKARDLIALLERATRTGSIYRIKGSAFEGVLARMN